MYQKEKSTDSQAAAQEAAMRQLLASTPAGMAQLKPATTVYEQAQALTRTLLELNPTSRTTAEVVNLLLGSMDPHSRQRTIRALCEVYEVAPMMIGQGLGIIP